MFITFQNILCIYIKPEGWNLLWEFTVRFLLGWPNKKRGLSKQLFILSYVNLTVFWSLSHHFAWLYSLEQSHYNFWLLPHCSVDVWHLWYIRSVTFRDVRHKFTLFHLVISHSIVDVVWHLWYIRSVTFRDVSFRDIAFNWTFVLC